MFYFKDNYQDSADKMASICHAKEVADVHL